MLRWQSPGLVWLTVSICLQETTFIMSGLCQYPLHPSEILARLPGLAEPALYRGQDESDSDWAGELTALSHLKVCRACSTLEIKFVVSSDNATRRSIAMHLEVHALLVLRTSAGQCPCASDGELRATSRGVCCCRT